MLTVSELLDEDGARLCQGVADLVGPDVPLYDINGDGSSILFVGPHFGFADLDLEGKRLQSRVREEHRRFAALSRSLLRGQADDVLRRLSSNDDTIRSVIDRVMVWESTTGKAMETVREAMRETLEMVSCLDDPSEGAVILVPDTNALIHSPAIQSWAFDSIPAFEMLLVPTVLSEMDELKTNHRQPAVRDKVKSIIRQIKEFSRRGSIGEGVSVVDGRIRIRAFAVEPDVQDALPWLDPGVLDDRILASTVEAMRAHTRSTVCLVTGDLNLQNKAAFAGVAYIEPPEDT